MKNSLGSIKPAFILIVAIYFLGKTIWEDYEKYNYTYTQIPITDISNTQLKTYELVDFIIKDNPLRPKEEGAIELYEGKNDSTPKVVLIVENIDEFRSTFNTKNKIIVNTFNGIHQGSPKFIKNYILSYGMRDFNNELKKVLIYEEYFSWKSVFIKYSLFLLMIIFLTFLLLARVNVY